MTTTWITTGLPYANGALHAGHLYEWLLADTYARLSKRLGRPVAWITGDDAHGVAVSQAAKFNGTEPGPWVDQLTATRRGQLKQWGLQPSFYGTTHDSHHYERVQCAYQTLVKQDLVVEVACSQYFVDGVPLFERDVQGTCRQCQAQGQHLGSCDHCGCFLEAQDLVGPTQTQTGQPVELSHVDLIHFRWGVFREQVRAWVEEQSWPDGVREKLRNDLAQLPDLWCIERSGEYFGVPIPGREGHFYVWFDALLGYGTFASQAGHSLANAPVHVIGKDILTFHALRWPAVCAALGEPLPAHLLVHGHLVDKYKGKLSKSKGNAPDLDVLVSQHGWDVLRLDWVGGTRGEISDISLDEDRLLKTRQLLARRLGNTYRRLFGLVDVHQPQPITNPNWTQHLLVIEQKANGALVSGDFASFKEACTKALDDLNECISQERWWEPGKENLAKGGWDFLLEILGWLHPLAPETTGAVVDKLAKSEALCKDDLFYVAVAS